MFLRHLTIQVSILSEIGVGGVSVTPLTHINVVDRSEGDTQWEADFQSTGTIEGVTLSVTFVELVGRDGVRLAQIRTDKAYRTTITIVVTIHLRILIEDDVTISITHVNGVNRSNIAQSEDITRRTGFTIITQIVAIEVYIRHVCTNLQPLLQLIVSLQAASEALVVRRSCDTVVAEIVDRTIERTLVVAALS